MIYNLFGFNYIFDLETFRNLMFVFILGILINIVLSVFLNQYWLRSMNSLFISGGLVLSIYIITKVVSTNIALSLGLVGALSIVRFRTPIKNPFELIYYFILIAFGIVSSVDLNLALNLFFSIILIAVIFRIVVDVASKLNFINYTSFDEKEFTLFINSNKEIEYLSLEKNLVSLNSNNTQKFYEYIFTSNNSEELFKFIKNVDDSIINTYSVDKRNNFNI